MDKKDFFISYNHDDEPWALGIACWLEGAGYSVVVQAKDFTPGSNFVLEMQKASERTHRTIAVLSPSYLLSNFTQPEWAAAFAEDPRGERRKLIPVRVRECEPTGLLKSIVYIDVVGLDQNDAHDKLLAGIESIVKGTVPDSSLPKAQKVKKLSRSTPKKSGPPRTKAQVGIKQTVTGDGNVTVGGDMNINPRIVNRTGFTPSPEHITQEQAYEIKRLIKNLSEISTGAGGKATYKEWYSKVYRKFKVSTYLAIPREQGAEVVKWLRQQNAQQRRKLRRPNNEEWRKQLYSAIYAKAKELGMSKADVYALAEHRLKMSSTVRSLGDLKERQLKSLYDVMMRM